MIDNLKVLILAGGESKRMGRNKALIEYHGKPQILHLTEIFHQPALKTFISIKDVKNFPDLASQANILFDSKEWPFHGPISGLLGAFESFPESNWLLIACDYPLLDQITIQAFLNFIIEEPEKTAAFRADDDQFYEPLLAYYPHNVYKDLRAHIQSGDDSLQRFLQKMNARAFIPENINSVRNANTINEMLQIQMHINHTKQTGMHKSAMIDRVSKNGNQLMEDFLASEEPLEIRVTYPKNGNIVEKSIAVTMRTPGMDEALSAGFLLTEGLVSDYTSVTKVEKVSFEDNTVLIHLKESALYEEINSDRQFFLSSSCGICGKGSIESVRTKSPYPTSAAEIRVNTQIIMNLPKSIEAYQTTFERTGGLHAAALFTLQGELVFLTEDIGRHNAVDKLIGHCWLQGLLPLDKYILLLSGRGGFELIQKAYMAGIKIVASIGAPSSLAVEMARESEMTLIGFLKADRMNVYSEKQRSIE